MPEYQEFQQAEVLIIYPQPNRTQKIPGLWSLVGTCKASVCRGGAQQRQEGGGRHLETWAPSKGGEGQVSAGRRCEAGGQEENRAPGRVRPGYLFFSYMGTHTQYNCREKRNTPQRQTAPYLIHGWERSPCVGVWVVLLSRAQGLLIFILAPQHEQKSFCKKHRGHTEHSSRCHGTVDWHLELPSPTPAVFLLCDDSVKLVSYSDHSAFLNSLQEGEKGDPTLQSPGSSGLPQLLTSSPSSESQRHPTYSPYLFSRSQDSLGTGHWTCSKISC